MLVSLNNRIDYGDTEIIYGIQPRSKDSGKVLIKVHYDGQVIVHAPLSATDDDIKQAVKQRARWIWRQISLFQQQREHALPRQYLSGESHYYLGRQYLLKVSETSAAPGVRLYRGRLQVSVTEKSPTQVKTCLYCWYKNRAQDVFERRLDALLPKTLWVAERPAMRLQTMKKRWGSCSPSQTLTLNPHLVKASQDCIDYVLLHELCHIAEHNHGKRFYQLMRQIMPDYKIKKCKLDGMAEQFLNDV